MCTLICLLLRLSQERVVSLMVWGNAHHDDSKERLSRTPFGLRRVLPERGMGLLMGCKGKTLGCDDEAQVSGVSNWSR